MGGGPASIYGTSVFPKGEEATAADAGPAYSGAPFELSLALLAIIQKGFLRITKIVLRFY